MSIKSVVEWNQIKDDLTTKQILAHISKLQTSNTSMSPAHKRLLLKRMFGTYMRKLNERLRNDFNQCLLANKKFKGLS